MNRNQMYQLFAQRIEELEDKLARWNELWGGDKQLLEKNLELNKRLLNIVLGNHSLGASKWLN